MRKRIHGLASLVALGASGYALYRTWRLDTRLGVALTLIVVALAVTAMCRESASAPAALPDPGSPQGSMAIETARRIRADAFREELERQEGLQ
jgi:hypothetical protein